MNPLDSYRPESALNDPFTPNPANALSSFVRAFNRIFMFSDDPDYEPRIEGSIDGRAEAAGVAPESWPTTCCWRTMESVSST